MNKERLDVRMIREGLAPSREKAKALIGNGQVQVDSKNVSKAGVMVDDTAVISILGETLRYVSRGGLKLEKALQVFSIDLDGRTCIDAGASTGGFTDCMLQNGAKHVYAVDVGHDQLAEKLRGDARVTSLEGTNVRDLSSSIIPEQCDFGTADLSFISLTKTLEALAGCLKADGELVCLVKPQFEAGRALVGKKGVVRDAAVHEDVLNQIVLWCLAKNLVIKGLSFSPVRGPEGNIEYLLYLGKSGEGMQGDIKSFIQKVVKESHDEL